MLLFSVFIAEIAYFGHQYSTQADIYTSSRRNDGFKELVTYVNKNKSQYDAIYLPAEGNTALYYLFFTKNFSSELIEKFGFDAHIDNVDNVHFIKETCPGSTLDTRKFNKKIF